jgi:hypothetical protein
MSGNTAAQAAPADPANTEAPERPGGGNVLTPGGYPPAPAPAHGTHRAPEFV